MKTKQTSAKRTTEAHGMTYKDAGLSLEQVMVIVEKVIEDGDGRALRKTIDQAVSDVISRCHPGQFLNRQGRASLGKALCTAGTRKGLKSVPPYWVKTGEEFQEVKVEPLPHAVEQLRAELSALGVGHEGAKRLALHIQVERDRAFVIRYKELRAREPEGLRCDACVTSFVETYGRDYIECHHTFPVAEMENRGAYLTDPSDLVLLCANCHRMAHFANPGAVLNLQGVKDLLAAAKTTTANAKTHASEPNRQCGGRRGARPGSR